MTYIKKFLPEPDKLLQEYEKDPKLFVSKYQKYEVFLGNEESKILLDKLIDRHTEK